MKLPVYTRSGSEAGREVEIDDAVFGLEPNDHVIWLDVRSIQAAGRQGTHKTKERGEVSGSNKKPYRQKGTGNARSGSRKSPLWRHGGRVFGPKPRDYGFGLNKKVKSLARKSALTYKAREEQVKVVENFGFDAPKTKEFINILDCFELSGKKVLMVLADDDKNIYLSGRNIPKTEVRTAAELNTYDILNAETLILTEGAVKVINERLAN